MPFIKASIIIPAFNEEKTISSTLEALLRQTIVDELELIIVDDGSNDNTCEIIKKYPQFRYFYQENAGPAKARNKGTEIASSDIILFTDADCIPKENWAEKMLETFNDPEVVACAGRYTCKQKEIIARYVQLEYEERYRRMISEMKNKGKIDFISTYSAGFRRETFLLFEGFNTKYPNAAVEDHELSFRMYNKGLKMVFQPEASIEHEHPVSLISYIKRKINVSYWKYLVLKSHPDKIKNDSNTPQELKIQIGLVGLFSFLFISSFIVFLFSKTYGLFINSMSFFFLFMHIVLSLPFYKRSLSIDKKAALYIPYMDLVRSFSFLYGFIRALLRFK
ncbi:MAG: glycosyltransferase family 2 protein [Candidatus Coatesbacteria bacterium]|nr:glycosyltransferase family 2 protein [Candidatus Coatesbacteria bacterium]